MTKLKEHLNETRVDKDSSVAAKVTNDVQKAYEILEDVDEYLKKMITKMPDADPRHNKNINDLSNEIQKMMNQLDIARIMRLAKRIGH